jgi:type I restriction enzyme S subunit
MNKIEKMIDELCPEGVTWAALGSLVQIRNGKDFKHLNSGSIPVFGSGGVMSHVDQAAYSGPSVLIPRKGSLANLFYLDSPFWTVDTIFWTEIGPRLHPKFLYYFLKTKRLAEMNVAGGVPSLTQTMLNNVQVPVPPIEVQEELVSTLDKFRELEAELEAELVRRSMQFKFFCDYYFSENFVRQNSIHLHPLGDKGSFQKGSGLQKSDFVETGAPCIHYGQIHTRFGSQTYAAISSIKHELASGLRKAKPGDIVIADTAEDYAGVGKATAWLGPEPIAVGGHTLIYSHQFDPIYLSYFFRSDAFQNQKNRLAKGVKVKDISSSAMAKIVAPVPPVAMQEKIGRNLMALDTLIIDSPGSIKAEITARRQQYEYYRNKLLTFKELKAS